MERDELGRVPVDAEMRVRGFRGIYAAGDMAHATTDGKHDAVQSCQHAMPQGRYAGFNAAGALLGRPARPYEQRLYVTCLDLGEWGALLTEGWRRDRVLATGREAKELKRYINRSAIYPPLEGNRAALLQAAAPEPGGRAGVRLGSAAGAGQRAVTPDGHGARCGRAAVAARGRARPFGAGNPPAGARPVTGRGAVGTARPRKGESIRYTGQQSYLSVGRTFSFLVCSRKIGTAFSKNPRMRASSSSV